MFSFLDSKVQLLKSWYTAHPWELCMKLDNEIPSADMWGCVLFYLWYPPPPEKVTGAKCCEHCSLKEQRIWQIQGWWTKANNFQVPTATLIIFPLLQTFLCLCNFNNCQTLILNCKHFDRASSPSLFYSSSHINIATN